MKTWKQVMNEETQIMMRYLESKEAIADKVRELVDEVREESYYYKSFREYSGYSVAEMRWAELKKSLCNYFVSDSPDLCDTVFHELLKNSLMKIEWGQIASYLLDEVYEEVYA